MSNPVNLALDSTLADPANGQRMAAMYVPDDDIGNRWALEKVTWRPTDASLAALPFPIVPDTDAVDVPLSLADGPTAYYAHVVIADIPEDVNPAGDGQGFIGGTLAGASLRIAAGRISIELAVARRIPVTWSDADPHLFVTADDLAADFPTVTPADVDTALSAYDARLAHP